MAYICGVVLLAIGILFAFLENKSYLTYLLCGILFPLSMHVYYKVVELENINKNIRLRDGSIQIYTFDEEGIELEQISNYDTFKDKYTYKDIIRIVKYKKYYFLYINRVQALVVNNIDYVYGNEMELDKLFNEQKGKFFIKKGRRARQKRVESSK